MLYSLYNESQVLRQVQRELLQLLRSTPQEDIDNYFNQAVADLHNDWNKTWNLKTILCYFLISYYREIIDNDFEIQFDENKWLQNCRHNDCRVLPRNNQSDRTGLDQSGRTGF